MTLQWSDNARNKYIAPEIAVFTAADIPDLSSMREAQANNQAAFILNSALRGGATVRGRQLFFNAIRRINSALGAYGRARGLTLQYLDDPEGHELTYVNAIDAWEETLGHLWQALALIANGVKQFWFQPDDGSIPQRLNVLHNTAKHADERIIHGTLHDESPIGVWLTRDGLKSSTAHVDFSEMQEVLELLAGYSEIVRDPATFPDKYPAWLDTLTDGLAGREAR